MRPAAARQPGRFRLALHSAPQFHEALGPRLRLPSPLRQAVFVRHARNVTNALSTHSGRV
jgi:hypothetical protein